MELMPYTINPNNEVISRLIKDYSSGLITTIYGNAASGKTTSCLLAAIEVAKNKGKVIYLDTESSFDTDRLSQLHGGDITPILENIFLLQPKSFEEQDSLVQKLFNLCGNEKIKLIVVDTIGNFYRVSLNEDHKTTNNLMAVQLQVLTRIARDMDKVVLMTNQAGSKMDSTDDIKMVGGNMMLKMSKCVIELHKTDDIRQATLVKDKEGNAPGRLIGFNYHIKEKGLFLL